LIHALGLNTIDVVANSIGGLVAAFYDRSRNSRVRHDAHICGNAVKLGAHRAPKRLARLYPSGTSQTTSHMKNGPDHA
jgi:pimeloyl-ACP methyl ester carboxylesterase